MVDNVSVKLEGLDELKRVLFEIPRQLRNKVLIKALRKSGSIIRAEAKKLAPVLQVPTKYRKPKTVRDSIKLRVSKEAKREGNVGVFINVKPAKGASKGAYSKFDPYYWRWLEFGHRIVSRSKKAEGGGVTTYQKRLRNGRLVTRFANFLNSSLRSRRRNSVGKVHATPFLRPAANLLDKSLEIFKTEIAPVIQSWNKK